MTAFLGLAMLAAFVDWYAVLRNRAGVESVAKPLVMVALILVVVVNGPTTAGWLVAAGLGCSLIGDVLLLPRVDRFIGGLAAFLVAHVFFIAAFVAELQSDSGTDRIGILLGVGVALATWSTVGRVIVTSSRSQDPPVPQAVMVYIAVLGLMVASGLAVRSPVAAAGVVVFAGSDAILGWHRFVTSLPHGRLATHVLYHLGQALLALWAANLG